MRWEWIGGDGVGAIKFFISKSCESPNCLSIYKQIEFVVYCSIRLCGIFTGFERRSLPRTRRFSTRSPTPTQAADDLGFLLQSQLCDICPSSSNQPTCVLLFRYFRSYHFPYMDYFYLWLIYQFISNCIVYHLYFRCLASLPPQCFINH